MNLRDRLPRDLEGELRRNRPRPPDDFVRPLAERLRTPRASTAIPRRFALAGVVAILALLSLGAAGGLSYAGWRAQQAITANRGDEGVPHTRVGSTSPKGAEGRDRSAGPRAPSGTLDSRPIAGAPLQTGGEERGRKSTGASRKTQRCRKDTRGLSHEKLHECEPKTKADESLEPKDSAEKAQKAKDKAERSHPKRVKVDEAAGE